MEFTVFTYRREYATDAMARTLFDQLLSAVAIFISLINILPTR